MTDDTTDRVAALEHALRDVLAELEACLPAALPAGPPYHGQSARLRAAVTNAHRILDSDVPF